MCARIRDKSLMDVEQKEGEDIEKIPRAAGTPAPARQYSNGKPLERESTQEVTRQTGPAPRDVTCNEYRTSGYLLIVADSIICQRAAVC